MDGFYGEIRAFGFNYPPENWTPCDGRALSINANQALYAVIGLTYGSNPPDGGFYLPDLRGLAIQGQSPSGGPVLGTVTGSENVTLNGSQIPSHNHTITTSTFPTADKSGDDMTSVPAAGSALFHLITGSPVGVNGKADNCYIPLGPTVSLPSDSISPVGGNANGLADPHENRQPYLVMNFCICTEGTFPVPPQ